MMKPTVINTGKVHSKQLNPTVIQSDDHAQTVPEKAEGIQVSVIRAVPEKVTVKPSAMPKPHPAESGQCTLTANLIPSKISGYKRTRIPVSLEDVRKENPVLSEADLEKVLQYVLETDLRALTVSSTLLWQSDLQKQYSDKVMQLLECSQNESIAKAGSHVSRITEILEAIDLRGVCEYEKDGIISKLLKDSNKVYDTPEELRFAEKELKQIVTLLNTVLKNLMQLHENLNALNQQITDLGKEMKICAFAADFLSKYNSGLPAAQGLRDSFHERSLSLTHTCAQLIENEVARQLQLEHPQRLITTIQNAVLVMIPDWLGSITTIRSLLEANKKVTVTEVDELSDRKRKIIKHLN